MTKKTALTLLFGIILLGIGLRSYQLTARSLWFDEAFSWRLIQFSWLEMIQRDAADVHPPLYYLVLKAWSTIFATSLVSLRSLSVVLAAATIAASYVFTSYAFRSRGTGILAAALVTISGLQIQYAWEARMYTLGTALVLISSWFLLKAIRQPNAIWWIGYTVTTTAFAYTHYFAFFSIIAQALFLMGYILYHTRGRIGEILHSSTFWSSSAAALGMILFYSPWLPVFLRQNSQVQTNYWIPEIGGWSIPDTFYRMFAPTAGIPNHTGVGWVILAATPLALTLIGWLVMIAALKIKDAAWYVMLAGFIPFAIAIPVSLLSQSLYQDRFFVFAHLFIVIGLAALMMRLPIAKLRVVVISFALFGFSLAAIIYWLELAITQKPGARAAADYLYQHRIADEPIIVSSPFIYFSILHYAEEEYHDSTPKLFSPSGESSHFSGGPILTTDDLIGPSVFDTNQQILWVVDTSGFNESPLDVPTDWQASTTQAYPEIFMHQGHVFVTKYTKQ